MVNHKFSARLAISPQSNPALILSSLAISGFSLSLSSLSSTGSLSSASPVRSQYTFSQSTLSQSTLTINFWATLHACQKSIRGNPSAKLEKKLEQKLEQDNNQAVCEDNHDLSSACLWRAAPLWKSTEHNEVHRVAEHHNPLRTACGSATPSAVCDMNQAVHTLSQRMIGLCRISSWFPIMVYDDISAEQCI